MRTTSAGDTKTRQGLAQSVTALLLVAILHGFVLLFFSPQGCSRIAWHVFIDMGILAGVALTAGRRRATEPSATQACFQGDAHASAPASQKDELIYSLLMLQATLLSAADGTEACKSGPAGLMVKALETLVDGSSLTEDSLWALHDAFTESAAPTHHPVPTCGLHEVMHGLLDVDCSAASSGQATLGALRRDTHETEGQKGSVPPLHAMLAALTAVDKPKGSLRRTSSGPARASLELHLSKLRARRTLIKHDSAFSLGSSPTRQAAAGGLLTGMNSVTGSSPQLQLGNSATELGGGRHDPVSAVGGAGNMGVAGPGAESCRRWRPEALPQGEGSPLTSSFGDNVERVRWGVHLLSDEALKPAPLGKVPVPNVPAESEGNSLDCQDQILSARYQSCPQVDLQETSVAQQSSSSSSSSSRVSLQAAPMFEVEVLLEDAFTSYSFDAFKLHAATQGHPLSALGYYLLHRTGLISSFKLHALKLARFLKNIEAAYATTIPYHNAMHACDVLQMAHIILVGGNAVSRFSDPLMLLSVYLAAIMHDCGHGGFTNDFLKNSHDVLAIRYNDQSPLEQFHVASAFEILLAPGHGCNFLYDMTLVQYTQLRATVIDLVLATDMKQHFSLLGQANTMLRQSKTRGAFLTCLTEGSLASKASTPCKAALLRLQSSESLGSVKQAPSMSVLSKPDSPCSESGLFKRKSLPATFTTSARGAAREGQWCGRGASGAMHTGATLKGVFTAHDPRSRAEACSNACPAQHPLQQLTPTASKGWDKDNGLVLAGLSAEQRVLLLQIVLKCADLGHVSRDFDVHTKWLSCLEEELWRQGDRERAANLPVGPLFDRSKPGVSKCQVGFFDVIALPLFKTLVAALPGAQPLLDKLERNYESWKLRQARPEG